MRKIIGILWGLFAVVIVIFIISVFTASTVTTWRIFSAVAIVGWIAVLGTVIILVIDFIRSKKG